MRRIAVNLKRKINPKNEKENNRPTYSKCPILTCQLDFSQDSTSAASSAAGAAGASSATCASCAATARGWTVTEILGVRRVSSS
jgi:hypothetical protein